MLPDRLVSVEHVFILAYYIVVKIILEAEERSFLGVRGCGKVKFINFVVAYQSQKSRQG